MKFIQAIPSWLRSKYLLTGLCFAIWMLFFDRDDIPLQLKRIQDLHQLEQTENSMSQQIAATKKELGLLITNPSTLEKYAREKYMMKKENEDLYIFVKPGKSQ